MSLPDDQEGRLRCFRNALRNWSCGGYIEFTERTENWLRNEFPEIPLREVRRQLHLYIEGGGKIDEQRERRPEYVSWEFHYDLRVLIGARRIYFETLLICEDPDHPDGSTVHVVSVHDV